MMTQKGDQYIKILSSSLGVKCY